MSIPTRYAVLNRAIEATKSLSASHKPYRILEIGVHRADRSVSMINFAVSAGRPVVDYYGFDLFSAWTPEVNEAEKGKAAPPMSVLDVTNKLTKSTKARAVFLEEGDSKVTLPGKVATLPRMNIVFLDGGHSIDTIKSDLLAVLPVLAQGGILILDDYYEDLPDCGCASVLKLLPAGWHWALAEEQDTFAIVGKVRMVVVGVDEAKVKMVARTDATKRHAGVYAGLEQCGDNRTDLQAVAVCSHGGAVGVACEPGCDNNCGGRRLAGLVAAGDVELGTSGTSGEVGDAPVSGEQPEPDSIVESGFDHSAEHGATVHGGGEFGSEVSSGVVATDSGASGTNAVQADRSDDQCARAPADSAD